MKSKMISRKVSTLCFASVVAVVSCASLKVTFGQPIRSHVPIAIEFAVGQDAPVVITSITATRQYMCERVTVKNTSEQHISSVTFGVMLYPTTLAKAAPALISGESIGTSINPGQERTIHAFAFKPSTVFERIDRTGLIGVRAELGVLAVEFKDAAPWNFDPLSHGGFVSAHPSAKPLALTAGQGCGRTQAVGQGSAKPAIVLTALQQSGEDRPFGFFQCTGSDSCIYCTNNGTSCTVSECQINPEGQCVNTSCPHQTCSYVP